MTSLDVCKMKVSLENLLDGDTYINVILKQTRKTLYKKV